MGSMITTLPTAASSLNYSAQAQQRSSWLSQLSELIAFPIISALPLHRADLKSCAPWLAHHLAEVGLQHVQILSGEWQGTKYLADWLFASGRPTLLIYSH
jgi:acetylornithine deacetylase/succinyl-diaminopimelate desuccinylase-like protein